MIYFIQGEDGGPVKIGHTASRNVKDRLSALQSGSPVKLVVRATIEGSLDEEKRWHKRFAADRLHGEWFAPSEYMAQMIGCWLVLRERWIVPSRPVLKVEPYTLFDLQTEKLRTAERTGGEFEPGYGPFAESWEAILDLLRTGPEWQRAKDLGTTTRAAILIALVRRGRVERRRFPDSVWEYRIRQSVTPISLLRRFRYGEEVRAALGREAA